jgi:hypothetical protein
MGLERALTVSGITPRKARAAPFELHLRLTDVFRRTNHPARLHLGGVFDGDGVSALASNGVFITSIASIHGETLSVQLVLPFYPVAPPRCRIVGSVTRWEVVLIRFPTGVSRIAPTTVISLPLPSTEQIQASGCA